MLLDSVKDARVIVSYQRSRTKEDPRNKTIFNHEDIRMTMLVTAVMEDL